jgi:hypothetical protein
MHLPQFKAILLLRRFGLELAIPGNLHFIKEITISKLYFTICKKSSVKFEKNYKK